MRREPALRTNMTENDGKQDCSDAPENLPRSENDNIGLKVPDVAKPKRGMTQEEAQLLIDLLNVETALHGRGDRTSVLLAAALAHYRLRLEKQGGFVRLRPDATLACLKYIRIQQGPGWLKLIDTRVRTQKPRK
jgi:hypothetical protein